jgi:hypothetical protein
MDALLFGIDPGSATPSAVRFLRCKIVVLPIRAFHRGAEKPEVFSAKTAERSGLKPAATAGSGAFTP